MTCTIALDRETAPVGTAHPDWRARLLLPVLIAVAAVVSVISSLGAPLAPAIAATRHVSPETAQWSLTITLLVGAACGQVIGRLGDGAQRRRAMLGALGAVLAGCLLAATVPTIAAILAGRALQGLGLGLVPVAIATARDQFPQERVRTVVAALSVATAAGLGIGYPLTGLAASTGGISAAFGLGAVLTGIVLILAFLVLPPGSRSRPQHIDLLGALYLAAGLTSWLIVLSQGAEWGWRSARIAGLAVAGLLSLSLWTAQSLRTPQPLVQLRLLTDRRVLAADITALLVGVALYLLMSLVSRAVQAPTSSGYGLGHSPLVAGMAMLPLTLGSLAANRVTPALGARLGTSAVLVIGAVVTAASLLLWGAERSHLWSAFVALGASGAGMGFTFAAMPGLIVSAVPAGETSSANGFNQALRQLGGAVGSALSTALIPIADLSAGQHGAISGIDHALAAGIALCILNVFLVLALRKHGADGSA